MILSQFNSRLILKSNFPKTLVNIILPSPSRFPSGPLSRRFPRKILCAFVAYISGVHIQFVIKIFLLSLLCKLGSSSWSVTVHFTLAWSLTEVSVGVLTVTNEQLTLEAEEGDTTYWGTGTDYLGGKTECVIRGRSELWHITSCPNVIPGSVELVILSWMKTGWKQNISISQHACRCAPQQLILVPFLISCTDLLEYECIAFSAHFWTIIIKLVSDWSFFANFTASFFIKLSLSSSFNTDLKLFILIV